LRAGQFDPGARRRPTHLMKLYTRKGDDGGTVLLDGTRVRKDDGRIAVFGTLDELNAHVGVAVGLAADRDQAGPVATIRRRLTQIQSELFSIGAELAAIGSTKALQSIVQTTPEQVARLETWIDEACEPLAPLKTFVLPGGVPLSSQLHVCRTVCRRAERGVVSLSPQHEVNPNTRVFLNRLSDLLFAWGRLANHASGVADVPWQKPEA